MDTNYEDYEEIEECKFCKYCEEWLPLYNFSQNSRSKDGKQSKCRKCQSEYHTKWRTEINREGYNDYMRNYYSENKIISVLRTRLCNVAKGKQNTTMEYLGCSEEFFRSWLQYQFDDEMNWNNFGTYWQIDRVLPVSMFNHEDEEAIRKCWNWKNLDH